MSPVQNNVQAKHVSNNTQHTVISGDQWRWWIVYGCMYPLNWLWKLSRVHACMHALSRTHSHTHTHTHTQHESTGWATVAWISSYSTLALLDCTQLCGLTTMVSHSSIRTCTYMNPFLFKHSILQNLHSCQWDLQPATDPSSSQRQDAVAGASGVPPPPYNSSWSRPGHWWMWVSNCVPLSAILNNDQSFFFFAEIKKPWM